MPKTSSKAPRKKAEQPAKPAKPSRKKDVAIATVKDLRPKSKPVPAAAGSRRVIFIDVENTSSEAALLGALDQLQIDRTAGPTELVAVGNWRVIGQHVARTLAQRGARLLHTAPATGVKDWSDLSIAVASGIWLGRAQPGDKIEIISADRAFDAVADAAANLGVQFRRLTYGPTSGLAEAITPAETAASASSRRRRRGGRARHRGGLESYAAWAESAARQSPARAPSAPAAAIPAPVAAVPVPTAPAARPHRAEPTRHAEPVSSAPTNGADHEAQAASHEQIIATIARLTAKAPERGVNLDLLINALKAEGFGRPPGSPRLVTRLRKMKDVEVNQHGMVRLLGPLARPVPEAEAQPVAAPIEPLGPLASEPPAAEPETAEPARADAGAPAKQPAAAKPTRRRSTRGKRRPTAKAERNEPSAAGEP